MKLNDWFENEQKRTGKRVKMEEFGRKIGITGAGVKKILNGSIPKPETMAAIERETGGKVRPADYYKP